MRKKMLAAVLAASAMFCSCRNNDNNDLKEVVYHIYSNGTYIDGGNVEFDFISDDDNIDFYVPKGMANNSISRSALTEDELELYDEILEAVGTFEEKIPLKTDAKEYSKILELIRIEQFAYTQVSRRWSDINPETQLFDVFFEYRFDADELSRMNMASENAAKKIMEGITDDMDDYEKLKYFHDYLVLNCENSTNDPYADTVYGALVKKKALCEGYAKAFSYLCNLADIENVIVTGETYVNHMWNIVKLHGNWYHVDVTWDNPDDELHKDYPDIVLYQYFMVTDSVIKNNHIISDEPIEPPKANGINENYFIKEKLNIENEDEFFEVSERAIINAVKDGKQGAMVKFETNDMFVSVTTDLLNNSIYKVFDSTISKIREDYGVEIQLHWTDYYGRY
ncbi:MAG: hypothetical protein K2H23_04435, partial [Oscillospiraceae bacterium]|nr:hypothetical protein [Oscillospiraceae bacterium]